MGIENKVVQKYGSEYWREHKGEILAQADKHGVLTERALDQRTELNSKRRRHIRRHTFAYFMYLVEFGEPLGEVVE